MARWGEVHTPGTSSPLCGAGVGQFATDSRAFARRERRTRPHDDRPKYPGVEPANALTKERGSQGSNLESPVLETGALPIRPLPQASAIVGQGPHPRIDPS